MTKEQPFDRAMKKILSVSKEELQRRLQAEKVAKDVTRTVRTIK
ncbi:MAG TPA: hypothetical protein VK814_07420 [Acidobacteriaceae bacterium]|jgi:hypothetical protein|nr:hypothetical protein [Acidobacteriaceae bacterium]